MAQDNYNHPSYLTRQSWDYGPTLAGASGTSLYLSYPWSVRYRKAVGVVQVAGTIGTNVQSIIQAIGTGILQFTTTGVTTSTGTVLLGTCNYGTAGNTKSAVGTSGDMNALLPVGSTMMIVNGLDATATTAVNIEGYLDPSASWSGPNN